MINRIGIQNRPQPSFKSRIIVSDELFYDLNHELLKKQGKYAGAPYRLEQAIFGKEGSSDFASICTMGLIKLMKPTNDSEGFLFHLKPNIGFQPVDFGPIRSKISQVAKDLATTSKDSIAKLSGALIGGCADNNKYGLVSRPFYHDLTGLYEDLNVDFSAILGRFESTKSAMGTTDMYFSIPNDEIIVSLNTREPVEDIEELEKMFEFVHISQNDTIEFK